MKNILILITLFFTLSSNAQNFNADCGDKNFSNAGEQDDCWSEAFFKHNYKETAFPRFLGSVQNLSPTSIQFDNKTLIHWNCNEVLMLFESGIFYPQLLIGSRVIRRDSTYFKVPKYFRSHDSVSVSDFQELKFLTKSPKIKRFRFLVYSPGMVNPQVYFLELKNDKANEQMSLDDFIRESRLTFLKGAWIMI